jgi:glycosyltransferase involved in cell wall biosynthesis
MIDVKKYVVSKNRTKKLRVLHIGGTEKDANTVFDIIKLLKEDGSINDFEFYFIGKLNKSIDPELVKMPNLRFLGEVSEKSKLKVLSRMDVIIIPAYEAFPMTMLEGLASGLYVLTSKKNAAWRDFKKLGVKFFVAEHGKPVEYIRILRKLAEVKKVNKNPNKYSIYNRKIIIKNFDEQIILRKILEMFDVFKKI